MGLVVGGHFRPLLGGDLSLGFSAKNGYFRCRLARFEARFDPECREIACRGFFCPPLESWVRCSN